MPKRKSRSIRVADEEWSKIRQRAERAGMTRSEYIRKAALGHPEGLDGAVLHHELRTLVTELHRLRKLGEDDDEHEPQALKRALRKAEALLDNLRECRG